MTTSTQTPSKPRRVANVRDLVFADHEKGLHAGRIQERLQVGIDHAAWRGRPANLVPHDARVGGGSDNNGLSAATDRPARKWGEVAEIALLPERQAHRVAG